MDRSCGVSGLKQIKTKDRRGKTPVKLLVERAQLVENVASLREYLQRRHLITQAVGRGHIERVECERMKVSYQGLAGPNVESPLEENLNEVFLFHGTSPSGASGIASEDFQLALAGSNAGDAFGKGVYFAEDCMKCDEYTMEAPAGHKYAGLRPVLLCRVCLGRAIITEDRDVSYELDAIM